MFFEQLKKVCKERGTTPTTVTRELGLSTGSMSQWKNGSSPTANVVVKFADYFGITTDELMGRHDVIDLYVSSIRSWANNDFFTEEESRRIEEHFQELLVRYKDFVNDICNLRTGMTGNVDLSSVRLHSAHKLELLLMWVGLLPDYYFGIHSDARTPNVTGSQPYISSDEINLLIALRKLEPDKREALKTLLGQVD